MIEKTKKILTMILGALVVFSIIYGVFAIITNSFKEPNIVSSDETKLYMTGSNLVKDYTAYYHMQDCLDNMKEAVEREKIEELYELYMPDYKSEHTKDEVFAKLKKLSENDVKLKKAYKVSGMLYILQYEVGEDVEELFLEIGTNKGKNYQFAIIK